MPDVKGRTRWEYRVVRHYPDDAPSHGEHRGSGLASFSPLDALGAEGWELVGVSFGLPYEMVFKRPALDEPERDDPPPERG